MTDGPAGKPKIHVVHLLHTIDYGGVETIIINWIRALRSGEIRVSVVCFANPGRTERLFLEAASSAGIEVDTIPWNRRKPILKASTALCRILRERGADIIHTHNTYADLVGLVSAKRLKLRTVSSLYVLSSFGWKRKALEGITIQVLRFFDCVTAQCEATRQDLIHRGVSSSKVRLLHSGYESSVSPMDQSLRQEKRQEHGIDSDCVLLVNVARLYPEKAHENLLREFQTIHAERANTKLWILGRGPLEDGLKQLCTELGLDDSVWFVGYAQNFHEYMQLAEIQVHPSYTEGIPMAILSGMSVGLPVVASDVGGIDEVLLDGERGKLVPSADNEQFSEEFRSSVLSLIDSPEERARLGGNAADFIGGDYSLENAANILKDMYSELLER